LALFQKSYNFGMITAMGVTGHFMFMSVSVSVTALMAMRMLVIVIVMLGGGLGSLFPLNAFMATHQKAPSGDAVPVPAFEAAGGQFDLQRP
jgi:hypothetical protein